MGPILSGFYAGGSYDLPLEAQVTDLGRTALCYRPLLATIKPCRPFAGNTSQENVCKLLLVSQCWEKIGGGSGLDCK